MAKVNKPTKPKRFHVRSKDRDYFTSNLALLLKAAVPVGDALNSLRETSKSAALNHALDQMKTDIEEGMPLWRALERSGIVSHQTLALVQLGEQSGSLVDNLRVAAKQEEKQRQFRAKVRSALLYPVFVLGMTLIVGVGVAWFLLPRLADTFTQLHVQLPLITRILIGFGVFLREHGWWAVPLFLATIIVAGYVIFVAPKTRTIGQLLLFRTPGIGQLLREVELARFGYLLGTLLDAGLTITQALKLLYEASDAANYRKLYHYMELSFEDGYSLRASLPKYPHSANLLPPAVQQMIIAGEHSGALPETLTTIGTIYEEKADTSTANLETILEPIMLVVVWLGVLGVAVAVIMPIYSLVGGGGLGT